MQKNNKYIYFIAVISMLFILVSTTFFNIFSQDAGHQIEHNSERESMIAHSNIITADIIKIEDTDILVKPYDVRLLKESSEYIAKVREITEIVDSCGNVINVKKLKIGETIKIHYSGIGQTLPPTLIRVFLIEVQ